MLGKKKMKFSSLKHFKLCIVTFLMLIASIMVCLSSSSFSSLAFLFPFTNNAHAESQISGSSSIVTVTLTEGLAVRTLDSTATNVIESLDLELTPTPTGSFNKDTSIIDVATSNPSGYNLYMTSMGKDHSNNYTASLIHSNSTISDVIATLPVSGVTESAFSSPSTTASPNPYVDKWGYSINAKTIDTSGSSPVITDVTTPSTITYNSIPLHGTSDTLRSDVKTATESSLTPVTIGVNTDTSILAGTYSNTLLFTAAANPPYVGYTLKFNPNIDGAGGSGSGSDIASNMPATMTETVMATSYKFTVPDTIPTRPGYRFIGWSRTAAHTMGTPSAGDTGSGTDNLYVAGDKVEVVAEDMSDLSNVSSITTIYAIWTRVYNYNVTINCNSGSGCPDGYSETTTIASKTYTISSTAPTRSGYNFKGYLGSDSITYQPGNTITLTGGVKETITLTAQWAQVYNYSVTVNCNSGSNCSSNYSTTTENASFTYNYTISSTVPTRSGYAFDGYKGSDNVTYQPGGTVALSSSKRTVTLTAQWAKLYTYKVTYACNSGSGCPSNLNTTVTSTGYSYTIPSTAPTRTNYNFTGYLGSDGTTYQPGGTVTLNTSKLSVTLTAQWELFTPPAFFTIKYMQDMTPSICSSATTPSVDAAVSDTTGEYDGDTNYVPEATLIDYRGTDGTGTASSPATGSNVRSYTVRKLADGNCWMAENLKLTLTNNQAIRVGTFSGGETSWTPTGDGAGNDYNEAINANTKADVNGGNWYYPWYAATAGQGTNTASPTISQSICPKGWKLPNGGSNAAPSFQSLATKYSIGDNPAGSTKLQAAPLSYTAVSYYTSGSLNDTSNGSYWSASPYTGGSNRAYYLVFNSSRVLPQGSDGYKNRGFSVRCVAIP